MGAADQKTLDPLLLKHYEILKSSGLWDQFSELQAENRELTALINDGLSLFSESGVDKMIEVVLGKLLTKFIPRFLCFFIETARGGKVKAYYYENLKPIAETFEPPDYQALKDFFQQNPRPLAFALLEYQLQDKVVTDRLLQFSPEFVVPMTGLDGVHGVAIFGTKVVDRGYDRTEIEFAFRFMRVLSIACRNVFYHETSITDFKTGLYNHSYFMTRFEQELKRVSRHHSKAGLILMDLDHFKHLNDTYGHMAGDEVLASVAKSTQGAIRTEDIAARFGGEEFIVLVVECSEHILPQVAERIRKAVEDLTVAFKDERIKTTISLGCCFIDENGLGNPGEMLDRADRALYRSKSGGRNRTTLFRRGLLFKAEGLRASTSAV